MVAKPESKNREVASDRGTPCSGEGQQPRRRRPGRFLLVALLTVAVGAAAGGHRLALAERLPDDKGAKGGGQGGKKEDAASTPLTGDKHPFDAGVVIEKARALAQQPFAAPPSSLPPSLAKLTYDQYRDIRFREEATIWSEPSQRFRLQFLSPGYLFTSPVEVSLVENGRTRHLPYRPEMFDAGKLVPEPLPAEDVGFSGFRLLHPLNTPRHFDELVVFQGASYFRSLGRGQVYGLSSRGLALKVGDPAGEEFPSFRAFWVEEPRPRSGTVVVHALLDSPSLTGAYRFEVKPGEDTVMLVEAVLFPRVEVKDVGIAPGTSMFLFSAAGREAVDDFRPQVHDSDGLLMFNGRGEHLWRPLSNPTRLQLNAFTDERPVGFGLVQRERDPAAYQDFESSFERRPSLWVEPVGDWGPGEVVLAEIPTDSEIHDNIVAFWRPRTPLAAGSEVRLSYRLAWGGEPPGARDRTRIISTALGRADVERPTPVRRFVIDYARPEKQCAAPCPPPKARVTASAGKAGNVVVSENPLTKGYRLTFTLDPEKEELSELRAELEFPDERRAEVWLYRWTKP